MPKSDVVKLSPENVDVEYDEKGDVLYIGFSSDTVADDSELTDSQLLRD